MKILSIIAAVLISTSVMFAANENAPEPKTTTISGQVIDTKTGEALAGVKVILEDLDKVVYTDFDGNFEISNVVPGSYKINSSLISYNEATVEVNCKEKSNDLKISLDNK